MEIVSEREGQSGWTFQAQVLDDSGALSSHQVTLAWADYNLWSSDGGDEPAKVAEAVVQYLVARTAPQSLGNRFDASIARRKFSDADQVIPAMIRR